MKENIIILIEENYNIRLKHVISVAKLLNIDCYPKSEEFATLSLSINEYLNLIFTQQPYICVNLYIGETSEEVDEIVNKILEDHRIAELQSKCSIKFDIVTEIAVFHWEKRIACLIALISQAIGLRCSIIHSHKKFTSIEELLDRDDTVVHFYFKQTSLNSFSHENLYKIIYLDKIILALSLEEFWEKTNGFNCHINAEQNEDAIVNQDYKKALPILKKFMGTNLDKPLIYDGLIDSNLIRTYLSDCLQGICGVTSTVGIKDGKKPLSLFGAFHILLGAIAFTHEKPANFIAAEELFEQENINIKIEGKDENSYKYLTKSVLPKQDIELARASVLLLYEIFKLLAAYFQGSPDNPRRGKILIQSIQLDKDGMKINLCFNPITHKKTDRKNSLADTLHLIAGEDFTHYIKDIKFIDPHPSFDELENYAQLSTYIHAFNQAASISNGRFGKEGSLENPRLIFPLNRSVIKVYSVQDTTILHLCLIS
jgi:hypothetical protein